MKQRCTHCKQEKKLSEFGSNKGRVNGKHHRCLRCCREYDRKRDNTEKGIRKSKKYQLSERGKERRRIRQQRDYCTNKHKHVAKKIISVLIKSGKIKRLPCEVCGEKKSKGHHPDYNKPTEVIWLCQKHHSAVHRK